MEQIRDLLNPTDQNLALREDKGKIYVDGLAEQRVRNLKDVMLLLQYGNKNRILAQTKYNRQSSRSHTVFTITMEKRHRKSGRYIHAKFTCCDLAGSERLSKTQADGQQLEEAKSINLSLSALGNVVAALSM